ncbi:hypothetical protein K7X08_013655 [Anisodus acutangulus]|uniref:Uncharacterized protein n=1 Tax=Anisodus acutangulus TaxID=402998 RepID=A0A9Q1LLY9_9SOLA|nr:hypothetical protein K7X08_013655 [Anisodus acutangulus]
MTKKRKSAVESQVISCESIPGTGPETVSATSDDVDDMKDDVFAYFGGLRTDCADLNVNDNQGIRGGDQNVKEVKPNDGVGGGDSSKEVVDSGVVDGVGVSVGVGEGNDSQSDYMFVSVREYAIVAITQKEDVLPQGGDVQSADAGNEFVDAELAKGREFVLAPPPEDVARPQADQLAYEVPAKAEDTLKDCGVDQSGASGEDSDFEEKAHDFVISPDTNVVKINDDQTTAVEPQRGRPRRPANIKKSPLVSGSGLSELDETSLNPVKGRSPLIPSITSLVYYKFI